MSEIIKYQTYGTCCKLMQIEVEDEIIVNAEFFGGCSGNLGGIKQLIKGMKIDDVIAKLAGIDCGGKGTSCPDQLARCLNAYKAQKMQKA